MGRGTDLSALLALTAEAYPAMLEPWPPTTPAPVPQRDQERAAIIAALAVKARGGSEPSVTLEQPRTATPSRLRGATGPGPQTTLEMLA